jgi:hypothetical protein
MPSSSRNSLPSPVSDEGNESRGVQSGDSALGRERMERILVREKEKGMGRTSREPRKVFR